MQLVKSKEVVKSDGSIPLDIGGLLGNYQQVFTEHVELPPQRSHDHQIPFLPNQRPVSIHRYCCPNFKKVRLRS